MTEDSESSSISDMDQRAVWGFIKDPKERTRDDLEVCIELLGKIEGLKKLRREALMNVMGLACLHRGKEKSVLMSTKSYSCEYMYVLLEGRLYLTEANVLPSQWQEQELDGLIIFASPLIKQRSRIEDHRMREVQQLRLFKDSSFLKDYQTEHYVVIECTTDCLVLRFDIKRIQPIIDMEEREANKKMVIVERFFEGCLRESKKALIDAIQVEKYAWKSTICCKGYVPCKIYIVYLGSVALACPQVVLLAQTGSILEKQKNAYRKRVIKTLGPEYCFGINETKFHKPLQYDLIAHEPETILLTIDASKVWEIAKKEHTFYQNLMLRSKSFSYTLTNTAKLAIFRDKLNISQIANQKESDLNPKKPAEALILKIAAETDTKTELERRPCLKGRELKTLEDIFRLRDNQMRISSQAHDHVADIEMQTHKYQAADTIFFKHIRRR